MKTLYLDLFSGISGDMFIGALIDLGVDARKLERELAKLKLDGYHLHVARKQKSGIAGVKFDVHLEDEGHGHDHDVHETACGLHIHEHGHGHEHPHAPRLAASKRSEDGTTHHDHHHDDSRNFAEIKKLITRSKLSPWVKKKSLAVFQRIAEAEGKIHGQPPDEVHFHEVGAVDSIVDIAGGCIALEMLGKPRVLASAVTEGVGWVDCAHGRFPIPAPATLAILGARGIGVTQCEEPHELVTPTGAALLAELVERFGPMQGLVADKIGFGLGTRDNQTRPNVLRAVLGVSGAGCQVSGGSGEHSTFNIQRSTSKERPDRLKTELQTNAVSRTTHHATRDWETDTIAVLETNLDDINSEVLGHFVETALGAGALDVFHTPIQMKKSRPGVLLTVLCAEADADKFAELILRETTAFGVRRTLAERRKLRREFATVKTRFGPVTVKLGKLDGKVVQAAPEFEFCRKLADQKKVPVKRIYEAAVKALPQI